MRAFLIVVDVLAIVNVAAVLLACKAADLRERGPF